MTAIVVLALLLVPTVPVEALHEAQAEPPAVNETVHRPALPETGFVEVDQRLRELTETTDQAIAAFDRQVAEAVGNATGATPVRPIELLQEGVGPGERHGGIGPWNATDQWDRANTTPHGWTWWFGQPSSERYEPTQDALLLSPVIDLDTLGSYTGLVPGWRGFFQPSTHPDLFTLFLTHRFSFAEVTGFNEGLDGGRVELFTRFDPAHYEEGGHLLEPIAGPDYKERVRALEGPGYSGTSNWTVSAFDLSAWAGHRVRIGLRVSTISFGDPDAYFNDPTVFPDDAPRGWQVDNVTVRAPAIPSHLKWEPFERPAQRDDDTGLVRAVPGHALNVSIPLVNLGSERQTLTVRMAVADNAAGTQPVHQQIERVTLDPGEVHWVRNDTWEARPLTDEDLAWLHVEATGPDASPPGRQDPEAARPLLVRHLENVTATLRVDPMVADPNDPRTLRLTLHNRGTDSESVPVRLHATDPEGEPITEELFGEETPRERAALDPGERSTLTWSLTLPGNGRYDVRADVGDPTPRTLHAGVFGSKSPQTPPNTTGLGPTACTTSPWTCEQADALPADSDDGHLWVSGSTPLVGTPPGRGLGACLPEPPSTTGSGAGPSDGSCAMEALGHAIRVLYGTEGGPDGPVDTVVPGYEHLRLTVRYRSTDASVDDPPRVQVSLAQTDPLQVVGRLAQVGGGLRVDRAVTSSVHAEVELPISNGTERDGSLAVQLEAGWRNLTVDLEQRVREATGLRDAWDLSLEEVRIVPPAIGDLFIDHLVVEGVPAAHPEQGYVPLVATYGDAERDTGHWESRQGSQRIAVFRGPGGSEGTCAVDVNNFNCWTRRNLTGGAPPADAWTIHEGRWRLDPAAWTGAISQDSLITDQRLVTPPLDLTNTTDPVLVLDHAYATPSRDWGVHTDGRSLYDLETLYLVEVQYRLPNGEWSPFYALQPEGGYPTPEMETPTGEPRWPSRAKASGLGPGDGFYWPNGTIQYYDETKTVILEREVNGSGPQRDTFRLDDAPGGLSPPVSLEGRTIRLGFHAVMPRNGTGSYWNLTQVQVRDQAELSHDARLAELSIDAPFDLERLDRRIGPGTELTIEARVENAGLYDLGETAVQLNITTETNGREELVQEVFLPPATARTARFHWQVPSEATGDRVRIEAWVQPLEVSDLDPADNTERLEELRVKRRAGLSLATHVAPDPGSAGVPHALRTTLHNPGNVPLEQVSVQRSIHRAGTTPVLVREEGWTLARPLPPSEDPLSIENPILDARYVGQAQDPGRWVPNAPGTYRLDTRVTARFADPDLELEDRTIERLDTRIVEVLEPVFRDSFEGDRTGGEPGTDWHTDGDAWQLRQDAGFGSARSWWVGGERGYPHEAEANLTSPVIDLTSAKSAFLTLASNYSTEPFFDGATVEVTTDAGRTWTTLQPGTLQGAEAYPGRLTPTSPLARGQSPDEPPTALTGEMPKEARIDGWTTHTFPLGQIDALVRDEVLADLNPPAFDNGSLIRAGARFTRDTWALGAGPDAQRFEVVNATLLEPRPKSGGVMWYTGSQEGRAIGGHSVLGLHVEPDGRSTTVVEFQDWRPGTLPDDRNGTGASFEVNASLPGTPPNRTVQVDLHTPREQDDPAWTLRRAYLNVTNATTGAPASLPADQPILVNFTYRSEPAGYPDPTTVPHDPTLEAEPPGRDSIGSNVTSNRGWAIDTVTLRAGGPDGPGTPTEPPLTEDDPRWQRTNRGATEASPHWRAASQPISSQAPWRAARVPDYARGPDQGRPAWVLEPVGQEKGLPPNMDARLVSPVIDLRGLSSPATLRLDHEYNFQLRDRANIDPPGAPLVEGGVVEVQVFNETTQRFDPWRTLFPEPLPDRRITIRAPDTNNDQDSDCPRASHEGNADEPTWWHVECATYNVEQAVLNETLRDAIGYPYATQAVHPPFQHFDTRFQWLDKRSSKSVLNERDARFTFLYAGESGTVREDRFNLSQLAGKQFRLGLHAWGNPHQPTLNIDEHWIVHRFQVETELFEGRRVQFRVHFASDDSIPGSHVAVDDVSVGAFNYQRNLAIHVDETQVPQGLAPNATIWINGTVENRGKAPRAGVAVRLEDRSGQHELLWTRNGTPPPNRTGPYPDWVHTDPPLSQVLTLGPAGTPSASAPFTIKAFLPANATGHQLNLTARLAELPDPDEPRSVPLVDEVGGNKRADMTFRVGRFADATANATLLPDRSVVNEPVRLLVNLTNTGTTDLAPKVHINVTDERGDEVASIVRAPELPRVGPAAQLEARFTPSRPGNHTVNIEVVDGRLRLTETLRLPVDRSTSLVSTSWESVLDYSQWTRATVSSGERCRNVRPQDGGQEPTTPQAQWERRKTSEAATGQWHVLMGVPANAREAPRGYQDAALVSPLLDLSTMEEPSLTFLHRPRFLTEGAGVAVELQVLDPATGRPVYQGTDDCRTPNTATPNSGGWFLLRPTEGYTHTSRSFAGVPPVSSGPGAGADSETSVLSPLGAGHPILGGVSETWQQTTVALSDQGLRTPGTREPVELSDAFVRIRFRATTREATQLQEGWDLDNVILGDSAVRTGAGDLRVDLVDGARKELSIDVVNTGTRLDTYLVDLVEGGTTMPLEWIDLTTRRLTLESGETGRARLTLEVPVSENNQAATYTVQLSATSAFDPGVVGLSKLTFDVVPSLHPNLVARLDPGRPAVEAGANHLLTATVLNNGLTRSPTTEARLLAQLPDGTQETVATVDVPPVPPSSGGEPGSAQVAINWTAPRETLGNVTFHLAIDPDDRVVEYDESDNRAQARIEVVPLQRPDLVVRPGDLLVLDLDGTELDAAEPGDLVQVVARVHNEGTQAARNVQVALSMGADPVGQRTLARLGEHETRAFTFTVFAPGNATRLTLQAKTLDVELRDDNNEVQAGLRVRSPSFALEAIDGPLDLSPGTEARHALRLENQGTEAALVRLGSATEGLGITLHRSELLLLPGRAQTLEATLALSPTVPAGPLEARLEVERLDGAGTHTVRLPLTVQPLAALEVTAPDRSVDPGTEVVLPVKVTNRGNQPEDAEVSVDLPPALARETIRDRVTLDPGASRTLELNLPLDNTTAPGAYPLTIRATSNAGTRADTTVELNVEPRAAASVRAEPVQVGSVPLTYEVRVENTGNVPGRYALDLGAVPPGWSVGLDLPVQHLEPGQAATGPLTLTPTRADAATLATFLAQARIAPDRSLGQASLAEPFVLRLNAQPPDLQVATVDQRPRFDVASGDRVAYQVQVRNDGRGPAAPVEVGLYQNERLADLATVGLLSPGATALVNLSLEALGGSQSVVVSLDPHQVLVEANRSDNARGWELQAEAGLLDWAPVPAPSLLASLLALFVVAWRRRRDP